MLVSIASILPFLALAAAVPVAPRAPASAPSNVVEESPGGVPEIPVDNGAPSQSAPIVSAASAPAASAVVPGASATPASAVVPGASARPVSSWTPTTGFASSAPPLTTFLSTTAAPSAASVPAASSTPASSGTKNLTVASNGGPSVTNQAALAFFASDPSAGKPAANPATYTCMSGPASNFPAFSSWVPFEDMFQTNQAQLAASDSASEQQKIHDAILSISQASQVDARFILAIIMQESSGNVNVPCTNNGVENCGLMQAFTGSVPFNAADPAGSITQMIKDGTQGTAAGGGLVQVLNEATSGGNVYTAARVYNSGKADATNLSDGDGATASYVSDVANRVTGWNGGSRGSCTF